MVDVRWAEAQPIGGIVQHPFVLCRGSEPHVPGIAWYATPTRPAAPLVLLGHGGSGQKASPRNLRLATRLVQEHGINAIAIDGPFHGDRSPGEGFDYQDAIVTEGVEVVCERMVEEWIDTLRMASDDPSLRFTRVGYLGLSMGSRFGLPLIARLGARVEAAVLGKYGLWHRGTLHAGLDAVDHTRRAAEQTTSPVLLHAEWRDEIFPLEAQLALFEALASEEKTLYARNGHHSSSRLEDETIWLEFLALHLVDSSPSSE